MARNKFTRVVKFAGDFHTVSHQGENYTEDVEKAGYFEAPHAVADHFVEAGFVTEYANDMDAAKLRHADEQRALQQNTKK